MPNKLFGYSKKCESFAALVYYVHILGDHIADTFESDTCRPCTIHLADNHDIANSLMDELDKHLSILFDDQDDYKTLQDEIKTLKRKAANIQHSSGGINTEEKFDIYHKCAVDLMDALIRRVPDLLKEESFFKKVFY